MTTDDQQSDRRAVILVCDDEEIVLNSTAALLESEGYSVIRANSARHALDATASHTESIALLLTDVTMPGMNGLELAERLKQQHPAMKVIFTSGYTEDVLETHTIDGERIEFLQKPALGNALSTCVRKVLDKA